MRKLIIVFVCFFSMFMGQGAQATPLIYAAEDGNIQLINKLIAEGADINETTENGWTALMAAVYIGNLDAARVLLANGADIGIVETSFHFNALQFAAMKNRAKIVKAMLDTGYDPQSTNEWGKFPLWIAAYYGSVETIKVLCQNGANINFGNYKNETALMVAASGARRFSQADLDANVVAVRTLLECGADPYIPNKTGKKAADLALENNAKQEVLDLLSASQERSEEGACQD